MISRRAWIGSGIAAALLAAAGFAYEQQPEDGDRAIVAALAPVMLEGALPSEGTARTQALLSVERGFDVAVAGLTPSVQRELARLFTLLRFAPARMAATGVMHPWHLASHDEIRRFLTNWRYSGNATLRSGYDALHALVLAAWYGGDASWERIGYPGPPHVA